MAISSRRGPYAPVPATATLQPMLVYSRRSKNDLMNNPGSIRKDSFPSLTYMPICAYNGDMARSPTTTDAFNAIAEVRRREILGLLVKRELSVGDLVDSMDVSQPVVSKHLRVLREVGLVEVREEGRLRWYRVNAKQLKPVYDWVRTFERFWDHQLAGIKASAEAKAKAAKKRNSKKTKK